jgi:hypothetical protein
MIQYFVFVFLLVFVSELDCQCICGEYMGSHCGDRSKNGILKGNCDEEIMYVCHSANFTAQEKGYCSYCTHGVKVGVDFCSVEKVENTVRLGMSWSFVYLFVYFLLSFLNFIKFY